MPRHTEGAHCTPDGNCCCARRAAAIDAGRFLLSFRAGGWVWLDAPDDTGAPWAQCPWCAGDLPEIDAAFDKIHDGVRRRCRGAE